VSNEGDLYKSVIRVTHRYLGPAAERFIDRQIRNHLDKEPEQLTKQDLSQLVDWVRAAISLITDDAAVVEEYITQLQKLAQHKSSGAP
jgi:hypothetical protein